MEREKEREPVQEKVQEKVSIEEFSPELYDCEADGSCGAGHIHVRPY